VYECKRYKFYKVLQGFRRVKEKMQITDVRVRRVAREGKMKAVVSITIDNEFVIHDIKVIDGEKGLFIAMPSRKSTDGEFRDIAHPINSETRQSLQNLILQKYEETEASEETADYQGF
jgi:stage V sporulation protein G